MKTHRQSNISHKLTALLLLITLSSPLLAARYSLHEIDEAQANAINNLGTIVGVTKEGLPYVWRRNLSDMTYPNETDTPEIDRVYKRLLPTDFIDTLTEIHVLDINNESLNEDGELLEGAGANIVGWYIDENGLSQGIVWGQFQNPDEFRGFRYTWIKLPSHQLHASYCTGDIETDFPQTECMLSKDSDLIYRASLCATNANWEMPNNIIVDKVFDYEIRGGVRETPNCNGTFSVPICDYKVDKQPDGTIEIEVEGGTIDRPVFKYEINSDYNNQLCMLEEHANLVAQATQCDNSENFTKGGDPLVVGCDTQNQPAEISNTGTIIGTSFKPNGEKRPVIWSLQLGVTDDEGKPTYMSGDLGTLREVSKNTDFVSAEEGGELNLRVEISHRSGYPIAIDKLANSVVGMLRLDGPDSVLTPTAWNNATARGFDAPMSLQPPASNATISSICNAASEAPNLYPASVTPTSIATGSYVGWYEDSNGNQIPLRWIRCTDRQAPPPPAKPKFLLASAPLPALNEGNIGKALDNSSAGETVGTSVVNIVDENGANQPEDHAFLRTANCGVQDLNGLLEVTNNSLLLEEAYSISSGQRENPILALGKIAESGEIKPHVLTPKKIFTDLEIKVEAQDNTITVNNQQLFDIIISNNGAVNNEASNFATCIVFSVTSSVYVQDTYEDKIKQTLTAGNIVTEEMKEEFEKFPRIEDELIGGMTFSNSFESNKKVECLANPVGIRCSLGRLDPEDTAIITIKVTPRPLLADRLIRTTATVFSTESETPESLSNNTAFQLTDIEREACFIATAAYGSYLEPEVKILRQFRNDVLLQYALGRQAVDLYYDISPPLASYIAQHNSLRTLARWLLSPLVYAMLYPTISLLIFILFIIGMRHIFWHASRKPLQA